MAAVLGTNTVPTGSVQFFAGSTLPWAARNLSKGMATFTDSTLAVNPNDSIVAVYNGSAALANSTSSADRCP